MKCRMLVLPLLAAMLAVSPVLAEAPAKKAAPTAAGDADMDKYYATMQERYKKMQEQMERLRKTKDPKERQAIMDEHWKTMHEGMDMMMGRGGMGMGGRMGPGARMGQGSGPMSMSPEMMDQRQRRMEQRMDMMQMMMDQMMQHQGAGGPPASGK